MTKELKQQLMTARASSENVLVSRFCNHSSTCFKPFGLHNVL